MPRIPDRSLSSCVFIYPNADDAKRGRPTGGTGFIINVPCSYNRKFIHRYVVTNQHVIADDETPAIRFNTVDGGVDIVETQYSDWVIPVSPEDDIAVWHYPPQPHHQHISQMLDLIADEDTIREYSFGYGDDVFTLGRFIDVDNQQRNYPVARFGIVAAMPEVPIPSGGGVNKMVYLIEMRSRSGFSGSPVFIYLPPLPNLWDNGRRELHQTRQDFNRPWILGIQSGQMPVSGPEAFAAESGDREIAQQYGSGISTVVPGYKLKKFLLEDEQLIKDRQRVEEREIERGVMFEESASIEPDSNPSHKEDFTNLVSAAAKRKQPTD